MRVKKSIDGWLPTREQVEEIVALFLECTDSNVTAFLALVVDSPTGETWTFDTIDEFLQELSDQPYVGFYMTGGSGTDTLSVSANQRGTSVSVGMTTREQLRRFVDDIPHIAP